MNTVTVRPIEDADSGVWLQMRQALWPEGSEAEHRGEIAAFFGGRFPRSPWVVLFAEDPEGQVRGFVELSIRPYAEGCESHRVAYLEGWFVLPEARKQGVGGALVAAAEAWARTQECSEMASDTDPDNQVSVAAHARLGFDDAGLVRCFRKQL